jgi:hypothetical protein
LAPRAIVLIATPISGPGRHRADVGGDLAGGGRHLPGLVGRRLGGHGHLLADGQQLLRRRRQRLGGMADAPDAPAQVAEELGHARGHPPQGVLAGHGDLAGQVPFGGGVDHVADLAGGVVDRPADQQPDDRDHDEGHHHQHQHALPALGAFPLGLASGGVGELVHPFGELVESDVEHLVGGVDRGDLPRRRAGPVGDRVGDRAGGGQVVLHGGTEVGELLAEVLAGAGARHELLVVADRLGEDVALLGQLLQGGLALLGGGRGDRGEHAVTDPVVGTVGLGLVVQGVLHHGHAVHPGPQPADRRPAGDPDGHRDQHGDDRQDDDLGADRTGKLHQRAPVCGASLGFSSRLWVWCRLVTQGAL